MSFRRFLFDKTGVLIVQAASAIALGLYLSACSVALPVILLIYGCWLLILLHRVRTSSAKIGSP